MLLLATLGAGLVLLLAGGELLVRGSVDAASRLGVSKLIIGITLVGFGTSLPEMVTSIQAVYADAPGIAVGNIVGSNIANVLLVFGLTAALAGVTIGGAAMARDGFVVLAVTVAFIAVCFAIPFDRNVGIAFLVLLALYLAYTVRQDRKAIAAAAGEFDVDANPPAGGGLKLLGSIALAIAGLAMVIAGGHVLVGAAIELATVLGVPEHVIGLTIVAVGTSLPELATFLVSALRGHSEIGIGNLLGSNLFNILAIGGVTATLAPRAIEIPYHITFIDNFVMLAATLVLILLAWLRERVSRFEGLLIFLAYIAYLALLYTSDKV